MPTNQPITVLFVDDNSDVSEMFAFAAKREADIQVVGTLNNADTLLQEVPRMKPRILMIDLTMPGADPLEMVAQMHEAHPETRAIVFSGHDDVHTLDRAIEAGAWGFVSKNEELPSVFNVIRKVANGQTVLGQ